MPHDPDTNADHVEQGFGIKKSDFTDQGTTALPGTATIDVVINGQNIKQSLNNFLSNLDLAILTPVGASGATPVLELSGADNNIRGIEDGSGIQSSVSAGNGVLLKHNFQAGSGGASIFTDVTAASPIIGDLIQGPGISTAQVPGGVQISVSASPVSTKTVIINEMSDFPAAVGGVRTLVTETEYLITNDLSTADEFNVSAGDIVIQGADSSVITFTYTDTGDMFTGVNATFRLGRITISTPNGRAWNLSDSTGVALFQFIDGTLSGCNKIGLITGTGSGYGAVQINNVAMLGIVADGIEFSGTIGALFGLTNISTITAGSVYNLGTAVFGAFSIDDNLSTLGAGSFFMSGVAASANIATGGLGVVLNCRFSGAGTVLSNITTDDDLWQFSLNDDIRDSRADGLLSLQGNAVETVISGASTDGSNAVLVAGTWSIVATSQMAGTAGGRLTYTAGKDARLPVTGSVTVAPASGGSILINAYMAIDGVVDVASRRSVTTSSGSPLSITLPWQNTYSSAEFTEIFVENTVNSVNLLVSSAIHRVN